MRLVRATEDEEFVTAADAEEAGVELAELLAKSSPGARTTVPLSTHPPEGRQSVPAVRSCSGVGALPPRWAGIHQASSGPLGRPGYARCAASSNSWTRSRS